ncbi:MAG TPA: DsbA family oxidoreductase [Chloroflexia bacterium]|nr:DsbA family oxidoreductase [Chloroflexia bacterium]
MKVEIWSDIVCPWCYIGKRRFEAALARFPQREQVEVVWRSYELDQRAPTQSALSVTEMLAQKYGTSLEGAAAMNERVTGIAAQEGLDYHLENARYSNTFDAHRLVHLATKHGRQDEAEERLMAAYFSEGVSVGDTEALVQLAAEIGLDSAEARTALGGDAFADDVRADEQRARTLGINGVPFFVIDEKYGVSGAQPAATFSEALELAWAESHPLVQVGAPPGSR